MPGSICSCGKPARERYSYGIYAGRHCDDCAWNNFRDHCQGGDPNDLDEQIEPEPYYGMEEDLWTESM